MRLARDPERTRRSRRSRWVGSQRDERAHVTTWRAVAIPSEHGGWGLTLEPALLGLLVAPSIAGAAIGLAAFLAFLVRTPLKTVLVDRVRHRELDRDRVARQHRRGGAGAAARARGGRVRARRCRVVRPVPGRAPVVRGRAVVRRPQPGSPARPRAVRCRRDLRGRRRHRTRGRRGIRAGRRAVAGADGPCGRVGAVRPRPGAAPPVGPAEHSSERPRAAGRGDRGRARGRGRRQRAARCGRSRGARQRCSTRGAARRRGRRRSWASVSSGSVSRWSPQPRSAWPRERPRRGSRLLGPSLGTPRPRDASPTWRCWCRRSTEPPRWTTSWARCSRPPGSTGPSTSPPSPTSGCGSCSGCAATRATRSARTSR